MDDSIHDTFHRARQFHNAGRWAEAQAAYHRVLQAAPSHADTLHLLGLLSQQVGDTRAAIELIERAITSAPEADAYHTNLGEVHRRAGNIDDAMRCFQRALTINPDSAAAHNNFGEALRGLGRFDEAIIQYSAALQTQPNFSEALNNLGEAHRGAGRLDQAVAAYRRAISLRPETPEFYDNLGNALADQDRLDEAIVEYREALRLLPTFAEAHCHLGDAMSSADRLAEAVSCYHEALRLRADYFEAHVNLSNTLRDLGRLDEAVAACDRALAIDSQHAGAHHNRGLALLTAGDFARGWPEYAWRWQRPESPRRLGFAPAWDGSSLAGKSVLFYGEQGVGDEIMFASTLAEIVHAATRTHVECDPRLAALFARSFPAARVHARQHGDDSSWLTGNVEVDENTDVQTASGDATALLRPSRESFKRRQSFLTADADQVERFRGILSSWGPGLKIGISWRGGSTPKEQRRRSIAAEHWQTLLTTSGMQFVSLQYDAAADEIARFGGGAVHLRHVSEVDARNDLDALAALMGALDLVISVDNATVHLAGALGVPTWVALPRAADWRWLRDGDETLWYESLRLFRQGKAEHWDAVLGRMADEVRQLGRVAGG